MKRIAKNWIFKILTHIVENCGSQGKNRFQVITGNTLE
jgi:hypothetical protein